MRHISRRAALRQSAIIAASTLMPGWNREVWSSGTEPKIQFPTAARERLVVASWPFRGIIDAPGNAWARDKKLPGMDVKDFGAMVVREFNVHNIEPLDFHFRSTDPAYIRTVRETTEKAGAHIVNLPVDLRESYYDPDQARRGKAVQTSRQWIETAAALGSPSVRLHIAGAKDAKPDVVRAVESLKQVAEFAASRNVVANLENDDNVTEDPFFIVEVLDRVGNPYLRALPDFCNSMLTHDQKYNDRALRAMFSHAYCIAHVKDSEVGEKNKLFTVDVAACFEIAKASGYRGYFSMEWEGAGEPYAGTRKLIELSLKHLA
jgi:sugar phosphate isomerase/epimerase